MAATVRILTEPERETPVGGEYDVVVLGGGPAGIAAAAAAAAHGRKTLLVERYGFLGGMGTAAGVTKFCGLHANVHGEHPPGGARRRRRTAGAHRPARRPEQAASGVRQDPGAGLRHRRLQMRRRRSAARHGVDILFHALAAGVVDGRRRHASAR